MTCHEQFVSHWRRRRTHSSFDSSFELQQHRRDGFPVSAWQLFGQPFGGPLSPEGMHAEEHRDTCKPKNCTIHTYGRNLFVLPSPGVKCVAPHCKWSRDWPTRKLVRCPRTGFRVQHRQHTRCMADTPSVIRPHISSMKKRSNSAQDRTMRGSMLSVVQEDREPHVSAEHSRDRASKSCPV